MSYGSKMKDLDSGYNRFRKTVHVSGANCSKVLKLSNMGIEAIKSHESNAKHRGLAAVVFAAAPIQSFLQPSTLSSAVGESQSHASSSTTELLLQRPQLAATLVFLMMMRVHVQRFYWC